MKKEIKKLLYTGSSIIPFKDVQHVDSRGENGVFVIMKSTRYNFENDEWDNAINLTKEESIAFVDQWGAYLLRESNK